MSGRIGWNEHGYEEEQRARLGEITVGKLCTKCRGCGCYKCNEQGVVPVKLKEFMGEGTGVS
jgi:hypothetical protein